MGKGNKVRKREVKKPKQAKKPGANIAAPAAAAPRAPFNASRPAPAPAPQPAAPTADTY